MSAAAAVRDANTYLTGAKLWRAVLSLNVCNIAAFCDIIGIGYVLEEVMDHYYDSTIVGWATTTQLLGATVGQCLLGYLSDLFPRRNMLLFSIVLLLFTSLGCALCIYSSNAAVFVVVRTISGVAFGSMTNLVNVAQNDFLPERRRLNFQGMQGGSVALGSILGSLAGATLAMAGSWQCLYYIEAGLSAIAAVAVFFWLPPNKAGATWPEIKTRLCTIDYFGILSGIGCIVPGLLLLCRYDQFRLSVLISSTAITILCGSIFLYFGFTTPFDLRRYITNGTSRDTIRPIVPFRIFRNPTIAALLTQNIFFGAAFYTFIYYTPFQLQVLRDIDALAAAVETVPYFITHGLISALSAQLVVYLKNKGRRSYSLVMSSGFAIWTTHHLVLAFGIFVGLGTGSVFQNSVVALSSAVDRDTKAVAVGTRNVLRFFGGALGTAISYAVLNSDMRAYLPPELKYLAGGNLSTEGLSGEVKRNVQRAASKGLSLVFYASAMMLVVCLVLCWFVKDDCTREKGGTERVAMQVPTSRDDKRPENSILESCAGSPGIGLDMGDLANGQREYDLSDALHLRRNK